MTDAIAELLATPGAAKAAQEKVGPAGFKDELGEFPDPFLFPPGRIGVVCGDHSRYTQFTCDLALTWMTMTTRCGLSMPQGTDIPGNCNTIVRNLEEHERWLWILGDDHFWPRGTLPRMLAHMANNPEVDILVPHCLKRVPPFSPVVYSHQNEDGWWVSADLPRDGLVEVEAAGSAGMLVKREVFEALGDPYFRPDPNGVGLNEDLYFCVRAREAGFRIWCAPEIPFGHFGIMQILPRWGVFGEAGWDTRLALAEGEAAHMPGIHRRMKERDEAA